MEELSKDFQQNVAEFQFKPMLNGFARLMVSGELTAGGKDHRLVMQINNIASGYRGFIKADGDWGGGEWEGEGIYLGRNAWNLDAQFASDIFISANGRGQRIIASSLTSFSMTDNRLAGYQSSGVVLTNESLDRLRVKFLTNGVARGIATLLLFRV